MKIATCDFAVRKSWGVRIKKAYTNKFNFGAVAFTGPASGRMSGVEFCFLFAYFS
jgi:hypothetical protein